MLSQLAGSTTHTAENAPDSVVKDEDALRARHLLEELLDLGIIYGLDALVVVEFLLDARVLHELEPVLVKRELFLASARIADCYVVRLRAEVVRSLALWRLLDVLVRLLGADRCVVVEDGRDVVGSEDSCSGHGFF